MLPREEEHYLRPLSLLALHYRLPYARSPFRIMRFFLFLALHYRLPCARSSFRRSTHYTLLSSSIPLFVCVLSWSPFLVRVLSRRSVEDDVPYAHVIQRHVYILDGLIDRGPLSLVLYTQVFTESPRC